MAARLDLHIPLCMETNQAKEYSHIVVKPLASSMGAEITFKNSDGHIRDVTDEIFNEIEAALFIHKMIFFRNQKMTHDEQANFSRRFGTFAKDAYTKGMPENENVQPLIKEADTEVKVIFGSGWHTDSPFLEKPPSISTLRSVEIPPYGGDTMWANSALAYSTLSDVMKEIVRPLKVLMSGVDVLREIGTTMKLGDSSLSLDSENMIKGNYHPMVRVHPVTGEKSLYVDVTYSKHIQGMSTLEAEPILKFLQNHITQPAFTCRLRWEPDMFVAWDNRICLHQAFNDYNGHRREMYRTTTVGEVPQGISS
eukprot:TRINITY_DN6586_c0_g1_i2.p1 TRINITY_DN6586_c0_g1~~TRINITY_DN6586_c0_g1_i2.p1  ORF type:complete len:329 (+),score=37.73 TRINITY_DN6586_c0_g1_i2:61-987(+)